MRSFILIFVYFLVNLTLFAQDNYRTRAMGDWNSTSIWEKDNSGNGIFQQTPIPPNNTNSSSILIRATHVVTIPSGYTVEVDQVLFENSGTGQRLVIANGGTLILANGDGADLAFNVFPTRGRVEVFGVLEINNLATISSSTSTKLFIKSGGLYRHKYVGSGVINLATWETGATLEISNGVSAVPTQTNQTFYNVIWDCPTQDQDLNLGLTGSSTVINGNLTIRNTGVGHLFFSSFQYDLNILGNLNLEPNTNVGFSDDVNPATITIGGNFNNFSSGYNLLSVASNVTLNIGGDFINNSGGVLDLTIDGGNSIINLAGNFSVLNGSFVKSGFGSGTINFIGTNVQGFTNNDPNTSTIDYYVANGAILNLGSNFISGSGNFTLASGGTLHLGSTSPGGSLQTGISGGNIRVSGVRTFMASSTIVYDGLAAQQLGNAFPSDVNLQINNASGVSLSSNTTINTSRILTLTSGNLNIGSYILTINGTVARTSGFLSATNLSELVVGGSGALGIIPFDALTTQLRNFTLNRTGSATLGSNIEIVNLIDLENGDFIINDRTLTLSGTIDNTSGTNSGFLSGNLNTSIFILGTGAFGEINFQSSGGNSISSLTLNRTSSGSAIIGNSVTINTALNLTNGTLSKDPTENIVLAANATITRQASGAMDFIPVGASVFNVTYLGATALTTGLELPTSASGYLNNLTINTSNSITLNKGINVRGNLSVINGTLSTSAFSYPVDIAGNFTNTGAFNANSSVVNYYGSGSQIIGRASYHSLRVSGVGLKTLEGNISTSSTGTLTLNGGDIDLNGFNFTINNPSSSAISRTSGSIRSEKNSAPYAYLSRNVGTSTGSFTFPLGNSSGVYIPAIFTKVNTGDIGILSVATFPTDAEFTILPAGISSIMNTENAVKRFWQVEKSVTSPMSVVPGALDVTYTYAPVDDPTTYPNGNQNLRMQRWNSDIQDWDSLLVGQTNSITNRTITIPGVSSFSPWGSPNESTPFNVTPTPVELLYFKAAHSNSYIYLDWATASETKSSHFVIERSNGVDDFRAIGSVESAGNSSSRINYEFKDVEGISLSSKILYYRLRQVDVDGQYKIYPIKEVYLSAFAADDKIHVNPNPASTKVWITSKLGHSVNFKVYNSLGKLMHSSVLEPGTSTFSTTDLEKGVYLFRFKTPTSLVNKRVIIE